jgi:hypothetical protein
MLNLTSALKISAIGILLAVAATVQPAVAGDDGAYCDDSGYHCYRVRRDDDSDYYRRDGYYDGGYGRDYGRDYDGDRHYVCDSDGDRCYSSRGRYWNFHEYYRRHGYHWDD